MKYLNFIFAILLLMDTSSVHAQFKCKELFHNDLFTRLQTLVSRQGSKINPKEMVEIISDVAIGTSTFPGFSPWVHGALKDHLTLTVQADQVATLAGLPYRNAEAELTGKPTLTAKDYFGIDLSLGDFGIKQDVLPNLEKFDPMELSEFAYSQGHKKKREFLNRESNDDPLRSVHFTPSMERAERLSQVGESNSRHFYSLGRDHREIRSEDAQWLFSTLVRENLIRPVIEKLVVERQFEWQSYSRLMVDKYILLISAYPELTSILPLIPRLGFDPFFNFEKGWNDRFIETLASRLKSDPSLLANFSLQKMVAGETVLVEGVFEAKISIYLRNPEDKEYNPLPSATVKSTPNALETQWLEYASRHALNPRSVEIKLDEADNFFIDNAQPEYITLTLKMAEEGSPTIADFANFYLEITSPQKRDYQDQLFVFE